MCCCAKNKVIFLAVIAFIVCACGSPEENLLGGMIEQCSIEYKLSDVNEVSDYYKNLIAPNSKYIAFKQFSGSGYKIVSLINNNENYILSASLAAIPNSTMSVKLDAEEGSAIFSDFNAIDPLRNISGSETPHPNCIFVALNNEAGQNVVQLFNPSFSADGNESSLTLYTTINILLEKFIPEYEKTVFSAYRDTLEKVTVGGKEFVADEYKAPSDKEKKQFIDKMKNDIFFEINQ
ncbi:MAG: hypothetical protein ACJA0N_002606 [Pseudohongiellaceae bacterium]|jgi:hypothetical protein